MAESARIRSAIIPAGARSLHDGHVSGRRRLLVGVGVVALLALLCSLPFLPWLMGIVGDVKSSYTATVPTENRGTYVVTGQGVMQLYSWYVQPEDFPPDAPLLSTADVRQFAVVQKQFADAGSYRLFNEDAGGQIAWASTSSQGTQLILRPPPLPPGRYMLVVPTDGMFGGATWSYFELQ